MIKFIEGKIKECDDAKGLDEEKCAYMQCLKEAKQKPINRVTIKRLDMGLRMVGIQLNYSLIDKIIDMVELIEDKGGDTSLKDVSKLQADWETSNK